MGQKVNPIGFRLAVTKDWRSRWFGRKKDFASKIAEDFQVRELVRERLKEAAIARIIIERFGNRVHVAVHSARPGLVIAKQGKDIETLKSVLSEACAGKEVFVDIVEVKSPETDAYLVAEGVAQQLERRVSFRRAMKKSIQTAMDMGVDGIKIKVSGRVGGADIARTEHYAEGKVPLQTLSANIDYGFCEANTTAGKIGIKVWICKPVGELRGRNRGGERGPRERGPRGERNDRGGERQQRAPRQA